MINMGVSERKPPPNGHFKGGTYLTSFLVMHTSRFQKSCLHPATCWITASHSSHRGNPASFASKTLCSSLAMSAAPASPGLMRAHTGPPRGCHEVAKTQVFFATDYHLVALSYIKYTWYIPFPRLTWLKIEGWYRMIQTHQCVHVMYVYVRIYIYTYIYIYLCV